MHSIQPTESAPRTTDKHMPALDGLRGWAVLAVMFYHFALPFAQDGTSRAHWATLRVLLTGSYGVDMFFVLSGFLITGILLDSKSSRTYFRTFYARRVLRIFPLYYGVLAVCFGLLWWMPVVKPLIPHQAWLWFYVSNFSAVYGVSFEPMFSHFWSLAIEEQFYIVWPVVVLLVSRRSLMWLSMVLAMFSLLSRCWLINRGIFSAATAANLTCCRLEGLAMGAMLAGISRGPNGLAGFIRWGIVLASVAGAATVSIKVFRSGDHGGVWGMSGVGHFTMSAAVAGILILTVAGNGLWKRILSNSVLQFFGRYSYGLYVFHYLLSPWINVNFWYFTSWPVLSLVLHVLGACAVSVVAALVSWHLYEKQFLKLKSRFTYEYGAIKRSKSLRAGDMMSGFTLLSGPEK